MHGVAQLPPTAATRSASIRSGSALEAFLHEGAIGVASADVLLRLLFLPLARAVLHLLLLRGQGLGRRRLGAFGPFAFAGVVLRLDRSDQNGRGESQRRGGDEQMLAHDQSSRGSRRREDAGIGETRRPAIVASASRWRTPGLSVLPQVDAPASGIFARRAFAVRAARRRTIARASMHRREDGYRGAKAEGFRSVSAGPVLLRHRGLCG